MLQSVLNSTQVAALCGNGVDCFFNLRNCSRSIINRADCNVSNAKAFCAHILDIQFNFLEIVSCIANLKRQTAACCFGLFGSCHVNQLVEFFNAFKFAFCEYLLILNFMDRNLAAALSITDCKCLVCLICQQCARFINKVCVAFFKCAQVNQCLACASCNCAVFAYFEDILFFTDIQRYAVFNHICCQVKCCASQLTGICRSTLFVLCALYVPCASHHIFVRRFAYFWLCNLLLGNFHNACGCCTCRTCCCGFDNQLITIEFESCAAWRRSAIKSSRQIRVKDVICSVNRNFIPILQSGKVKRLACTCCRRCRLTACHCDCLASYCNIAITRFTVFSFARVRINSNNPFCIVNCACRNCIAITIAQVCFSHRSHCTRKCNIHACNAYCIAACKRDFASRTCCLSSCNSICTCCCCSVYFSCRAVAVIFYGRFAQCAVRVCDCQLLCRSIIFYLIAALCFKYRIAICIRCKCSCKVCSCRKFIFADYQFIAADCNLAAYTQRIFTDGYCVVNRVAIRVCFMLQLNLYIRINNFCCVIRSVVLCKFDGVIRCLCSCESLTANQFICQFKRFNDFIYQFFP